MKRSKGALGALGVIFLLVSAGIAFRAGPGPASGAVSGAASVRGTASPISTFQLNRSGAYPLGITTDSSGNVWFAEDNSDAIVEFTPANSIFHTFQIPTPPHLAWIWFLVFAGGNLWFSDSFQHLLWSFSPETHSFSNYSAGGAKPFSLTYDPGRGRLWFTSLVTNQIGYFQLEGDSAQLGRVFNITAPSPGAGPSDLVLDGSGNLYVTETFQAKIVELSGTDFSVIRTWQLPRGSEPVGLSFDSARDRIWFTNHASSYFGYVGLGPSGGFREFSTSILLQNGTYWVTLPYWVSLSSDGSVWFDEHASNRMARFDPGTMQLTEFPISTSDSAPLRLAIDDQRGLVWFTEFAGSALGVLAENSSKGEPVSVSTGSVELDPSASFLSSGGPASSGPPMFGFTGTVTGQAEPAFVASSVASGAGYEVTVEDGTASPGNYTEAVCYSYQATDQCGYVMLNIPAPASAAPVLEGIYLGLVAAGAVILYAVWRDRASIGAGGGPSASASTSRRPLSRRR